MASYRSRIHGGVLAQLGPRQLIRVSAPQLHRLPYAAASTWMASPNLAYGHTSSYGYRPSLTSKT